MTKLIFINIFLISLIFNHNQSYSQTNSILVKFINPKTESITDEIELPATIKSNEQVKITSTVSEKIEEILFNEGVSVKKDKIIVVLNNYEETLSSILPLTSKYILFSATHFFRSNLFLKDLVVKQLNYFLIQFY